MAGTTLVDGTSYEIGGGTVNINGTEYSINVGKVLVDGTEYDIEFIKAVVLDLWSGASTLNCITYANGYWVVGGTCNVNNTLYARIAYTTDPFDTWTIKDLWSSTNESVVNCITYANGYWVAGGKRSTNSTSYAQIAYTTDLTGTWTTRTGWSSTKDSAITCCAYADGYWVFGGHFYSSSVYQARMGYITSLSGTMSTSSMWAGSNSTLNCITYANGYWVVGGAQGINKYSLIAYTTDPTSTWTTKIIWTSGSGGAGTLNCITYANGYWVVGGKYVGTYSSSGTSYYARIAYTTDLTGTWTTKNLWSDTSSYEDVYCITYANGYWVAGGKRYTNSTSYAQIAYTTDLTGAWITKALWENTNTYNSVNCIIHANDYLLAGGCWHDGSTRCARIAVDSSPIPFNAL